jgi:hypothetical protein
VRLALVANRFPSVSETFIYNHAAMLAAAGIDVTVIATVPDNDAAMFADFDGTRFAGRVDYQVIQRDAVATGRQLATQLARAGSRGARAWQAAHARYGLGRRAVRAWLLALPLDAYDIVHLEYSGLAVAWRDALPLRARAKLVISCRGAAEQIAPLFDPSRIPLLRDAFAEADRVHCVSHDMQRTC